MSKKKQQAADDFSETSPVESTAVLRFKEKCRAALEHISDVEQFREEDKMVEFVFNVGRRLFDTPLDQLQVGDMLRTGGRLAGAYVYLGQKSARARAERDVYAQKASEVEKERLLELLKNGVKTTEARAAVTVEIAELTQFIVQKECAKNQWENITDAVEKMVSFVQSAIKVKEGERYHGSRLPDNT